METVKISFDIDTSDAECPLGIEIWLDNTVLLTNTHVQEKTSFSHDMIDNEGEHELRIVILGKTSDHTTINQDGDIIKDATIAVSNVTIDGIDINQLVQEQCVYTHDFNGTKPEIEDNFYGTAGCNGTISFRFTTPIYLWLLENM